MDLATIIGLMAGLGLIALSIIKGGNAQGFVNVPSLMTTVGGAISATLISFPLKTMFKVFAISMKTILHQEQSHSNVIVSLVKYAEKARKEGMLSLEEEAEGEPDQFLRKGLMLAVDGTESELLSNILMNEMSALQSRHEEGQNVFKTLATFFPAFGMIGTLVGLVQMLSQMNDPSKIGPGMAVALLTTFYGAFAANLFCLPMVEKLKGRSEGEVQRMHLILEGILAIKAGDTPRVVGEKLKAFISPKERTEIDQDEDKA
ncbi:MAG: motility protein A [Candidatus Krumholzibacteriota bacterium]|nr:motility protein A [Candidatus Krumholzibacteriota bacterium]